MKTTAVICKNLESFERWAKERRILKNKFSRYVDQYGERYAPIFLKHQTVGYKFDALEELPERPENYEDIKSLILIRIIKS
jgi:hypothetical protein